MLQFGKFKNYQFYHLENQYFPIKKIIKLCEKFINNEKNEFKNKTIE